MAEVTETERGSVETSIDSGGISVAIEHELRKIDWKEGDEDIREAIGQILDMEFSSPYAMTYQDNLKNSYVLYGRDGVKTQIRYLIGNIEDEEKEGKVDEILDRL